MGTKCKPQQNSIFALIFVLGIFTVAVFFFDFYYDLNDDVLIKDILSGAYNGTPDGHSIQMLYPLSLIISLLYRIFPMLPWQGLFLCTCHGVCFYLIAKRSLSFLESKKGKVFILLIQGMLTLTLFLWELVMVQYTVTSALLASCACFLAFTAEKQDKVMDFLKVQRIPIALIVLAFNVRTEMLLLMSPFIAFTGIVIWAREKTIFTKKNFQKYGGLLGAILIGLGISLLIDFAAYADDEWKAFRDFFDARTKVYDYTWYPDYETAETFYSKLGVTKAELTLVDNYNFGLDESIDADMLWSIADYAEETGIKEPLDVRLKNAASAYLWRTFHGEDMPYNLFVITGYIMVALLAVVYKDCSAFWKIPLLVVFRTIPWMYVIMANRVPQRISHPLYLMEFLLLLAWLLSYYEKGKKTQGDNTGWCLGNYRTISACYMMLFAVFSLCILPTVWQNVLTEMDRREAVNEKMNLFDAYASEHADNYYYMDVYSTVSFSEKMFENVDNRQKNYDILGGWASGCPLQKTAIEDFSADAFSKAELLLQDNFYYVTEKERDTDFLYTFYAGQNMAITLEQTDIVGEDENPFVIYKVNFLSER